MTDIIRDLHHETLAHALSGIAVVSRVLSESQVRAELDQGEPLDPAVSGGLHAALHCLSILAESRLERMGVGDD
jgi:hypothetical protein